MSKITKGEVRRQVYGVLIAKLRGECLIDETDPDVIAAAWEIQQQIAEQLEARTQKSQS